MPAAAAATMAAATNPARVTTPVIAGRSAAAAGGERPHRRDVETSLARAAIDQADGLDFVAGLLLGTEPLHARQQKRVVTEGPVVDRGRPGRESRRLPGRLGGV